MDETDRDKLDYLLSVIAEARQRIAEEDLDRDRALLQELDRARRWGVELKMRWCFRKAGA